VFVQLFSSSPKCSQCFYNSIETQRTGFLFLLDNTAAQKENKLVYLLVTSLRQQLALVLCSVFLCFINFPAGCPTL